MTELEDTWLANKVEGRNGGFFTLDVQIKRLGVAGRTIVQNLDFQVAAGEVLTIMGPSGSGKSSLLAAVAGTASEAWTLEGAIYLAGENITLWPPSRRGVGMLFQDDLLFAHMTVGENLLFAVPATKRQAYKSRIDKVSEALEQAGLSHIDGIARRDPATLSGGQRARVALMRALLAKPRVLLLDEPFSKLDTTLRASFRDFVYLHIKQRGIAAVLVTHDESDIPVDALGQRGRVLQLAV